MGRRDPDPRPPIEIVGAPSSVESVQVVSTGPPNPRRSTGRVLASVVGVALLLVGGLALGGGDDDERAAGAGRDAPDREGSKPDKERTTTTRRRTTTTRPPTTTTTIPVGPVFGRPVGAGLLAWGNGGWQLVDLDTGARTEVDLPGQNAYEARAVPGGVVMVAEDGSREAYFHAVSRDGSVTEPVLLGLADQVLPAGRPDHLWLVDGGGRANEGGGLIDPTADVRLVDLRGDVLRSFPITARFVSHGLDAGLVLERAGRVYLADERGIRAIAVGYVLGVVGDDLMLLGCDDEAVCSIERRPVDGGPARPFISGIDVETVGYESITAADGRIAMLGYGGETGGQTLIVFGDDGRRIGTVADESMFFNGPPRWLPDGLGLVSPMGDRVRWIREDDGEWSSVPVPALEDLPSEVALILEW